MFTVLPFLKRQKEASVSAAPAIITRKSDEESPEHEAMESEHDEMLEVVAQELIASIHRKDEEGVVECLRAAFLLLDSEPHVEGEHLEEEGE